jgi:DNA-binding NarL/FixJ family response regulator
MTTTHLTARERSVVHLAICGMKNREIAAELHLSVKTIEFHLANVYGKLSIRSRQDLRRRLTESA